MTFTPIGRILCCFPYMLHQLLPTFKESSEKGELRRLRYMASSRGIIIIDFLVSPRSLILPLQLAFFPFPLPFIHLCLPPFFYPTMTLTLLFIFNFLLSASPHYFLLQLQPSISSHPLSIHPSLPASHVDRPL